MCSISFRSCRLETTDRTHIFGNDKSIKSATSRGRREFVFFRKIRYQLFFAINETSKLPRVKSGCQSDSSSNIDFINNEIDRHEQSHGVFFFFFFENYETERRASTTTEKKTRRVSRQAAINHSDNRANVTTRAFFVLPFSFSPSPVFPPYIRVYVSV